MTTPQKMWSTILYAAVKYTYHKYSQFCTSTESRVTAVSEQLDLKMKCVSFAPLVALDGIAKNNNFYPKLLS